MDRHDDVPIFFDPEGRRWRVVRAAVLILIAVIAVLSGYLASQVLQVADVAPFPAAAHAAAIDEPPDSLTAEINQSSVPVIGSGAFVQVVRIVHSGSAAAAVPVYGYGAARPLTASELAAVGPHAYAIEEYGEYPARTIALTFDDGPDPVWTPRILDELARNKVRATFFDIGRQVVASPGLVAREAREGHVVGNHTFNHVNFHMVGTMRGAQELNQAQRVIQAASGFKTSFVRLPYGGSDLQSLQDFVQGILEAQQQGYVISYYTFDTNDWELSPSQHTYAMPPFDGTSQVVLLHDGGGNRSATIAYTDALIKAARAHGYSFVTLSNMLYPQGKDMFVKSVPSQADKATFYLATAYLIWPRTLMYGIFFATVLLLAVGMVINVLLAYINIRYPDTSRPRRAYRPMVSVVIPAYNEELVLAKTVRSIVHTDYRPLEIIIVDDGSKDNTWEVARELEHEHLHVRAYRQVNGGKARALNHGIAEANGEIIIAIDADTVFTAATIGNLVRHFADPTVGAVAGVVKVGNATSWLTRWQMLDYTVGIFVERNAQALLGSVMVVPGACGAWRKVAIQSAGGYSSSTLAEDFDLTLALHRAGWRVMQDNEALGFTEAPLGTYALFRQRFRWIFGDIQAFWKYRGMLFAPRHGWLGLYSFPLATLSIIVPLLTGPLIFVIEVQNVLNGNYALILFFLAAGIVLQFAVAAIGLALAGEAPRYLFVVPLTRFLYAPMRSFIIYRSLALALRGAYAGWNKLQRSGTVADVLHAPVEATALVAARVGGKNTIGLSG